MATSPDFQNNRLIPLHSIDDKDFSRSHRLLNTWQAEGGPLTKDQIEFLRPRLNPIR